MTPKEIILDLLSKQLKSLQDTWIREECEYQASLVGKREWTKHNTDDGVGCLSMCPYDPVRHHQRSMIAQEKYEDMQKAYQYAIQTFIEEDL